MAGGIGVRFWPMSRTSRPKQFIDILGTGTTLIQQTYQRFLKICPPENICIVTGELYKDLVNSQLPGLKEHQVLLEPERRNTAPCLAYAVMKIMKRNPRACMVVAPSDHIILQEDAFVERINTALRAAAENNWLMTLGINPTRPDTGYGYIRFVAESGDSRYQNLKKVKAFTEKPDFETALKFLDSGDYLWNSGIFIWSVDSILKALDSYLSDVTDLFRKHPEVYDTADETAFIRETYRNCKSISIDYGIMEKAPNVYVMQSDFGWSDLGTWGSLHDIRTKDQKGNAVSGKQVMLYDSGNCIVNMPGDKLVVLQGLDDYIVVEDENVLLVCRKKDEQQLRKIVEDIRQKTGDTYL